MRPIHIRFLDWNLPLLPSVTRGLLETTKNDFVDLSSTLIIVPTVQSGRRLRETLAQTSEGLFPPEIVTPDGLLARNLQDKLIANETTVIATWVSVLKSLDITRFETLFPIAPEQTILWQYSMAQRFVQLRNELGEEGLDFQQVAEFTGQSGHEPKRWSELAMLEKLYLDHLKTLGLRDPKQVRREVAQSYRPSEQIDRIILAATPDPQPLVLQALENSAALVPVEIWIYGSEETHFDRWGRPEVVCWNQRPLDFESWGVHLQSVATAKAATAFIVESMQGKVPESVLLGLADPGLNPIVASALNRADIAHYDPEGQPLHDSAIGQLIELICGLCSDSRTETVRALLQHSDMQRWLGITFFADRILQQLDRTFENHLAPDLSTLIHFAKNSSKTSELNKVLKQLDLLIGELNSASNFAEVLAQKLQLIYAEKKFETSTEAGIPWKECAEAIRRCIQCLSETESLFPEFTKSFTHTALKQSLYNSRVYPIRPQQAHDLLGWLELMWNDAPHLIVAGINEHRVPESVIGDDFLPESLREELGLRTNSQRFARDAYLIETLCRRRTGKNGRIDFLIPQIAHDQQPLKPSRLLFQGTSDTFLLRSRKLFQTNERTFAGSKSRTRWKMKPPPNLELPASLSISALKSYLQCPFRFFLKHILNMRSVDVETRELSPAAFGTLFHDTVAKLKGDTFDQTTKPGDLIKKLYAIAEHMFEHRYGKRLSFALHLQKEALKERIIALAEHQCNEVAQTGRTHISNTEEAFEISLEGFVLKGRIDRIDQIGNRLELIDYKTGNNPVSPESAHFALVGKKAPPIHLPAEAFIERDNKSYRWTDLQLPLYQIAKDPNNEKDISLAYFNLGQTVDKSGIIRWEKFSQELHDSAKDCATAILKKIKAGVFWPPNQDVYAPYDEFIQLFPDGIEQSVDPEAFANYPFLSSE